MPSRLHLKFIDKYLFQRLSLTQLRYLIGFESPSANIPKAILYQTVYQPQRHYPSPTLIWPKKPFTVEMDQMIRGISNPNLRLP